jgi:TRAP-type C4-dicarboxylate transport system permease small subunit
MDRWDGFVRTMCRLLLLIAGLTLAFMLVFTLADVTMRAFGKPIVGDYEVISFLGAVVVGFSVPYTSLLKGHVTVDFMLEMVPANARDALRLGTRVLGIALFLWMGWNFVAMSLDLIRSKEVTPVFKVPFYPIALGLAFTCLVQCLTLVSQIRDIVRARHE